MCITLVSWMQHLLFPTFYAREKKMHLFATKKKEFTNHYCISIEQQRVILLEFHARFIHTHVKCGFIDIIHKNLSVHWITLVMLQFIVMTLSANVHRKCTILNNQLTVATIDQKCYAHDMQKKKFIPQKSFLRLNICF